MMMILLVALIGLMIALGMAFWPWPDRDRRPRHAGGSVPPFRGSSPASVPGSFPGSHPGSLPGSHPGSLPASLEGVLAAQLFAGEITPRQYVRALERIAARDERRHPMSVPRDYRP